MKEKQEGAKYLKYSALGFEMIAAVLIGAWLGTKADNYFQTAQPYLTILFMLLGVATSIYILIKGVTQDENEK